MEIKRLSHALGGLRAFCCVVKVRYSRSLV